MFTSSLLVHLQLTYILHGVILLQELAELAELVVLISN